MINVAIVWHQHQPWYRDVLATPPGSARMPWVRLHAIRDYFSMANIVSQHPGLRLTLNFSPSLLLQIEEHVEAGVTDVAWELSRIPAERLDEAQKEAILSTFFEADSHNQIFPHARYRALYEQRRDGKAFSAEDLRDLQVWFNLAWFGKEMREGQVALPDGTSASVAALVGRGGGFSAADVDSVLGEQLKVMRAVIPEQRRLAAAGKVELSMSPFFHPILPLVIDTSKATIDRPHATLPARFAHPEDADAQVGFAVRAFERWFGAAPRGAWPAEGAVSEDVVPIFARHGLRWIASDEGVLARSGRWGYDVTRSEVKHRLYRSEADGASVSVLFRDADLSNDIGFHSQAFEPEEAARRWLDKLKRSVGAVGPGEAGSGHGDSDARCVGVILEGENAWGAYRDDGRPFLHALYNALVSDADVRTVTPSELIEGNPARGVPAQPLASQTRVYELFAGSWIDEMGSAPGADMGTWIGEPEENSAWELLGIARSQLAATLASRAWTPAYQSLLAAEGSDWFWWLGADQESDHDPEFDDLFRMHLRTAYTAAGMSVPESLGVPLVARTAVWTFARPVTAILVGDGLVIRTNCPGEISWSLSPSGEAGQTMLSTVGGVFAGVYRHQAQLGPFLAPGELVIRFGCLSGAPCPHPESARVTIRDRRAPGGATP